jgi:hypothetical protein
MVSIALRNSAPGHTLTAMHAILSSCRISLLTEALAIHFEFQDGATGLIPRWMPERSLHPDTSFRVFWSTGVGRNWYQNVKYQLVPEEPGIKRGIPREGDISIKNVMRRLAYTIMCAIVLSMTVMSMSFLSLPI